MNEVCTCDEFKRAREDGTDNEGYGAAINFCIEDKTKYEIAGETIKFCPWCGKKVSGKE